MSIPTCPHCLRKVIPKADNSCPSCGGDTAVIPQDKVDMALLSIYPRNTMPQVCHRCGCTTVTTKRLAIVAEPSETNMLTGFLAKFFGGLVGFIARTQEATKTRRITLNIPTCQKCAADLSKITPDSIDVDTARVDLVVHKNFKSAVQVVNT